MTEQSQTAIGVGRIDLGPREPRHITPNEQKMMDAALRRSVKVIPEQRDAEWWRMKCMEADQLVGARDAEIEKLRTVLRDLLQDTQHAEHRCTDPDCPVKRAREMLEQ